MLIYQRRSDACPVVVVHSSLIGAGSFGGTLYAKWGSSCCSPPQEPMTCRIVAGTVGLVTATGMTFSPTTLLAPAMDVLFKSSMNDFLCRVSQCRFIVLLLVMGAICDRRHPSTSRRTTVAPRDVGRDVVRHSARRASRAGFARAHSAIQRDGRRGSWVTPLTQSWAAMCRNYCRPAPTIRMVTP